MTEENQLAKLEGFVSTLLEKYNDLQGNNKKLTERLQRRNASIESLEGEIASMEAERGEISNRVSGLIGKIEEWEVATADEEEPVDMGDGGDTLSDSEIEEDKNESGIQGNLFSVDAKNE